MQRLIFQPIQKQKHTKIQFGLDALKAVSSKDGVLVIDQNILGQYGEFLQNILGYEIISIPAEKSGAVKNALENALFKQKVKREFTLVAVGGGSLTDLAAFVASTYMRGIDLIIIPTTLLGMVDAAIGGKTGIDTPFGKNLLGTFYLPKAIFIDPHFLKTLSPKEMQNGLSEILKYGLILDRTIWEGCKQFPSGIGELIHASILCKTKIVEQDFDESLGLRRILNFGHTVGHALETIWNISHGEAVALGCMAESFLSHRLGYLAKETLEEILKEYRKLNLSFRLVDEKLFFQALSMDKKGGFVLIDKIGRCVEFEKEYCRVVENQIIKEMLEWCMCELSPVS